jgi:hypothetical protein
MVWVNTTCSSDIPYSYNILFSHDQKYVLIIHNPYTKKDYNDEVPCRSDS